MRVVLVLQLLLAFLAATALAVPHQEEPRTPVPPQETPVPGEAQKKLRKGKEAEDTCPWPTLMELYEKYGRKSTERSDVFWARKEEGWFFGNSEKDEEEKCRVEDFSFIDADFLRTLPAPVFRKLLDDLMNYAVTHPTRRNVAVYMFAQWIAREKAESFMVAWSDVLRAHPSLDYTVARAPFGYATKQQVARLAAAREDFIRKAVSEDRIALVAFVSPDCVYCASQMPILLRLRERYGLRIAFVNTKERPDLVEKFGIEALPEIWLAVKGHGLTRIAAGLTPGDEILRRIPEVYQRMTGKKVLPDVYRFIKRAEEIDLDRVKEPFMEEKSWRQEGISFH